MFIFVSYLGDSTKYRTEEYIKGLITANNDVNEAGDYFSLVCYGEVNCILIRVLECS